MAVEQTDAQLVSRCRAGDPDAWNEFVERFSRYVFAICSRGFRLANHDAEDVFQEVFSRAFERLSELRSDDAVRPWLAQLTRRLCIDRLRLLARDTPSDAEPSRASGRWTTSSQRSTMRWLCAPPWTRWATRAARSSTAFSADESYRTIGDDLEIPAGTIASRISRCLDKVRSELDGRSRGSRPS